MMQRQWSQVAMERLDQSYDDHRPKKWVRQDNLQAPRKIPLLPTPITRLQTPRQFMTQLWGDQQTRQALLPTPIEALYQHQYGVNQYSQHLQTTALHTSTR